MKKHKIDITIGKGDTDMTEFELRVYRDTRKSSNLVEARQECVEIHILKANSFKEAEIKAEKIAAKSSWSLSFY
jgi:hypothetical protein